MASGTWLSLFSGGKDSSFTLFKALETGLPVSQLIAVYPPRESFLYHSPAIELTELAAESIGISLKKISFDSIAATTTSVREQGDQELKPLETELTHAIEGSADIKGITAGAVASQFQHDRIKAMCDRLGIDLFAPLWRHDPLEIATCMIKANFEIRIVQVAAEGLTAGWLGRELTRSALRELETLHDEYGVHILGEGGEYETIVTNGPHMSRSIEFEYEPIWNGTWGEIQITDAWLE